MCYAKQVYMCFEHSVENTVYSQNMIVFLAEFPVYVYKEIELIKSGGVEVRGLKASAIARRKPLGEPVLEKYAFLPHVSEKQVEI